MLLKYERSLQLNSLPNHQLRNLPNRPPNHQPRNLLNRLPNHQPGNRPNHQPRHLLNRLPNHQPRNQPNSLPNHQRRNQQNRHLNGSARSETFGMIPNSLRTVQIENFEKEFITITETFSNTVQQPTKPPTQQPTRAPTQQPTDQPTRSPSFTYSESEASKYGNRNRLKSPRFRNEGTIVKGNPVNSDKGADSCIFFTIWKLCTHAPTPKPSQTHSGEVYLSENRPTVQPRTSN